MKARAPRSDSIPHRGPAQALKPPARTSEPGGVAVESMPAHAGNGLGAAAVQQLQAEAEQSSHAQPVAQFLPMIHNSPRMNAQRQLLQRLFIGPTKTAPIQGYFTSQPDEHGRGPSDSGVRISDGNGIIVLDRRTIFATAETIDASNTALHNAGAIVKFEQGEKKDFATGSYFRVTLAIDGENVGNRIWERMQSKQPDKGFRSYADCYRTSASVSGMSPAPDVGEQTAALKLKTGNVPVIDRETAQKTYKITNPAARARLTLFLHTFPILRGLLTDKNDDKRFDKLVDSLNGVDGLNELQLNTRYRNIMDNAEAKQIFESTFGLNKDIVPTVGTAITQVNDDYEKGVAESEGAEKWNFHWAGVVMTDGSDYLTLENCAVEIQDATVKELQENSDMHESLQRNEKTYSKMDQLNDRWYFQLYGQEKQSFHEENLTSKNATKHAVSVPMVHG